MKNSKFGVFRSLRDNNEGGVLIMAAFFIILLFALGGAGIDFGRAYLLKVKLQEASDLAALAAANPSGSNPSPGDRKKAAEMYYNLNFPATYLGVSRPPFNAANRYTPTAVDITVSTGADMNTNFIRTMGSQFDKLSVASRSRVNIGSPVPKYDVILVLDSSDSMDWTFAGQKCGSNKQLTPVCNDGDVSPSINPNYCYTLTAPQDYYNCAADSRLSGLKTAANAFTDVLLDALVVDNNRIAMVNWNHTLRNYKDFSNNKDSGTGSVKSYITSMTAQGGTNSTVGLTKARQLASSFSSDAVHAVVLLTDGLNTGTSSPAAHDQTIDDASIAICDDFKNQTPPTIVYTVAVGSTVAKDASGNFVHPDGAKIDDFLRKCASGSPATNLDQYYFITAGDATQLKSVFQTIATNLQELRIAD